MNVTSSQIRAVDDNTSILFNDFLKVQLISNILTNNHNNAEQISESEFNHE